METTNAARCPQTGTSKNYNKSAEWGIEKGVTKRRTNAAYVVAETQTEDMSDIMLLERIMQEEKTNELNEEKNTTVLTTKTSTGP